MREDMVLGIKDLILEIIQVPLYIQQLQVLLFIQVGMGIMVEK